MSDLNSPVLLASFAHEMEADLLINALQQEGISARSSGATVSGFRAEAPGDVHVVVSAGELELAKRVMDELKEAHKNIDWEQIEVGDPNDERSET